MRNSCLVLFLLMTCLVVPAMARPDDPTREEIEQLKRENAALKAQVQRLELAVLEIRRLMNQDPTPTPPPPTPPSPPPPPAAPTPAPAKPKPGIDIYGFVKLDAAYDTHRVDTGNFARWVQPIGPGGRDPQSNMTANQTRVGINMAGPTVGGLKTSANVEIDFYGGGTENKPTPMLRHAFMKLDWVNHDFSILAGQTSDVIAPLVPETVNYTVLWWAGNPGYRRPQFRLTKGFTLAEDIRLQFQTAAVRTIGRHSGFDPGDTGEDAAFPTLQARTALSLPLGDRRKATFGVYGHWGQEEYDLDPSGRNVKLETYSLGLDAYLPLADRVVLQGEFWRGANLDTYLAGVGQGVNLTRLVEIRGLGGWASLGLGPWNGYKFNFGGSIDDPYDRDLNPGHRSRNRALFGNVFYNLTDAAQVGFEIAPWWTDYLDRAPAKSVRFQGTFIYRF